MSRLSRLLQPRHIAVFGGAWAENVITQLQKSGFAGHIWPVHPKKDLIAGLPVFRSVADLPEAPDASFVGVNRHLTPQIVGALSQAGAGGVVCFASGFAETAADDAALVTSDDVTGTSLQDDLLMQAGTMPVLGPNCYGFVNYLDNVAIWPDEHGGALCDRGVAIITQSSNMAITLSMAKRGLPIAVLVTAGNQAQLDSCDIADALLDDDRITAIGLHSEGIADLTKLEAVAGKARAKKIPIIMLKIGVSDEARAATMSHTASLAGSDESASALTRRLGIGRVAGLGSFSEALKLAHFQGALPDHKIASLSCSGGEASLMADACAKTELSFAPLQPSQKDKLADVLGPLVHLSNPLDYHTYIWGDDEKMRDVYAAMLEGVQSLTILILDPPRSDRCDDKPWQPARDGLIAAVAKTGKPAALLSTLPETLSEDFIAPLIEAGITPLMGLEDGLAAIQALADIGSIWQKQAALPLWHLPYYDDSTKDNLVLINEDECKAMMSDAGITVPKRTLADDEAGLCEASASITFPLVLKGLGFAHKTEAGAVRLNITSQDELISAASEMAGAKGFLVEEMVTGTVAELLVGIVTDPAHGPLLTIAAGSIYTEILNDKVNISLPARRSEIEQALQGLRIWPILEGYRGKPGCSVPALLDLSEALIALYHQHQGSLVEMEINPVLCTTDKAIAVDGLFRQITIAS
ncbi:MAG: acetate--CoA ligase family protein [Candidatus Puniceispirillaceae bacterium]